MKTALTTAVPVEVLSAEESAEILHRCQEKISSAYGQLRRGEQMNEGLRFVIGAQMTIAKPLVPHGNGGGDGFQEWLTHHWPQIEIRTAQNWMRFSSTVLAVAEKSKNETVSFFKALPEKLEQGSFDFIKDLRAVTDAVSKVVGDSSMMDFIEQHTERKPTGGSHQIKFTCPHCGAHNKGFVGRTVKCVDATCAKKITVKPDGPSAEEKIAQIIAGEKEVGEALIVDVEQWMVREHRAEFGRAGLQQMLATQVAWGKQIKALLKKKKGTK